jgi:hypothetical protein
LDVRQQNRFLQFVWQNYCPPEEGSQMTVISTILSPIVPDSRTFKSGGRSTYLLVTESMGANCAAGQRDLQ